MLLWLDSFDSYGTSNGSFPTGLDVVYSGLASQTNTILIDGRTPGGKAVAIGHNTTARFIETPSLQNGASWIIGFAYRPGVSFDSTDTVILSIMDSGSQQVTLNITASGQLQLRRGAVNGTTLGTSTATLSTSSWHYVELKVTIGNSGSYEVRLNGVNILSGSADTQNTANAQAQTVRFYGATDSSADIRWAYDDLYIANSDSGDEVSDFMGSRVVHCVFVSGAGDSTQFTPSTGSNYQCVDENPHDGDSTYVESGTVGHRDLYTVSGVTLTDIKGVMISSMVRETDGTPFNIKMPVKIDGTVYNDSGQPIGSTSYVSRHRVLGRNPDTNAAWTASDINSTQFGTEVA